MDSKPKYSSAGPCERKFRKGAFAAGARIRGLSYRRRLLTIVCIKQQFLIFNTDDIFLTEVARIK